jgi:glutaconyl-CoA/methylmalonyl-CoA decarboxylase subunit gamma
MSASFKEQIKVVVDGKTYVVEIEDAMASPTQVTVNGTPYTVDIHSVASMAAVPTAGAGAATPTAAPPSLPVAAPAGSIHMEIHAPMPGTIMDVRVKPGDRVKTGQELCFLEAMKMKNAIKAPHDATIATVQVAEGQSVGHGDILFTFVEGSVSLPTQAPAAAPAPAPRPAPAPQSAAPPPAAPAPAPAAAPVPVAAAPSANDIRAPMPGTILNVRVKVGDQVNSGQELCFLEAMKMKNAIRANRAGTIASVEVSEGQSVAHGQVLFTFE